MKKKRLLTDRSGDLLEEMMEAKAKEFADQVDADILRGMLSELGWHEVILQPMSWEEGYLIDAWIEENIKGRMWTHGLVWMFEESKDANWFKLRWLS
jgi:hypothetical protein